MCYFSLVPKTAWVRGYVLLVPWLLYWICSRTSGRVTDAFEGLQTSPEASTARPVHSGRLPVHWQRLLSCNNKLFKITICGRWQSLAGSDGFAARIVGAREIPVTVCCRANVFFRAAPSEIQLPAFVLGAARYTHRGERVWDLNPGGGFDAITHQGIRGPLS